MALTRQGEGHFANVKCASTHDRRTGSIGGLHAQRTQRHGRGNMKNLDGTFSSANYRHIWDEHARRGRLLTAHIPEMQQFKNDLRNLRAMHKQQAASHADGDFQKIRAKQLREIEEIKSQRRAVLSTKLDVFAIDAAKRIRDRKFDLGLRPLGPRNGKVVYRLDALEAPATYFLVKQLERNIRDAFDVRMPNRHRMISQLATLLRNKTPKTVMRLDVAACFESISHDALLEMLQDEPRLGQTTRDFLEKLLADYRDLTGKPAGLPRGVGISSFLAEAFLKSVDGEIRLMPGVTYYARYVDDIVVIVTDANHDGRASKVRDQLTTSLRQRGLRRNAKKERWLSSTDKSTRRVTLLGYELSVCIPQGEASLDMSKARYDDYVTRLNSAFVRFAAAPGDGAATALDKRVQLLTSNQRLWRPGGFNSNGIRFSHRALTTPGPRMRRLDDHLQRLIHREVSDQVLRERPKGHSFVEGFLQVRFMRVKQRRREQITAIWRSQ